MAFIADRLAEVLALAALSVLAAVQELASCRLQLGACRAALELATQHSLVRETDSLLGTQDILFVHTLPDLPKQHPATHLK